MRPLLRHSVRITCFIFSSLLLCTNLAAKTFTVTSFTDGHGPNTLRGAIIAANHSGGHNTIILAPGHYRLTIPGSSENYGLTGDLDISGKLTITTQRGLPATIDARNLGDRVFHIQSGAKVTMENLVITGGTSPSDALNAELEGGGILNLGTIKMDNCVIDGNKAGNDGYAFLISLNGGDGGGIYNSGTMSMSKCVIRGNFGGLAGDGFGGRGGDGGGIFNTALLSLNNCSISNNCAGRGGEGFTFFIGGGILETGYEGGSGGAGGGIYNVGKLTVNASRITANQAGHGGIGGLVSGTGGFGGAGGGIYNDSLTSLKLSDCVISNNVAGTGGDGQTANGDGQHPILDGISDNGGDGGIGGNGGGIFNENGSLSPMLYQCLVAFNSPGTGGSAGPGRLNSGGLVGNTGADGTGPDLARQFATQGHNLIRIGDGSTGIINGVNNDTVGTLAQPANP